MRKKKISNCLLLCFVLLVIRLAASAQSAITVEGTVSSADSNSVIQSASVTVKGANKGISTDANGHFRLSNVSPSATLVFSAIGFKNLSVQINGKTQIDVSLETAEATTLDQVVVVGYGTQQKKDLTGAVAQVKVTQLENENPNTVSGCAAGKCVGIKHFAG